MYNILVLYGVLLCDLSKYFAQKLLFVLLPYYYYGNIHGLYSFCSIRIMKFTLKKLRARIHDRKWNYIFSNHEKGYDQIGKATFNHF